MGIFRLFGRSAMAMTNGFYVKKCSVLDVVWMNHETAFVKKIDHTLD